MTKMKNQAANPSRMGWVRVVSIGHLQNKQCNPFEEYSPVSEKRMMIRRISLIRPISRIVSRNKKALETPLKLRLFHHIIEPMCLK
jgi:hypothetical protein